MNMFSRHRTICCFPVVLAICLLFIIGGCKSKNPFSPNIDHTLDLEEIRSTFIDIPDTIQTSIYWYWISDHLSKEGVIEDLKAMKAVGINRAFIGNIGLDNVPYGKVKIFSDEWWEILHTTLKTATELNIEIGIFNSPGWSQSGGPWIKPGQSMRYLSSGDTVLIGGQHFSGKLPIPEGDFQHVKTLALKLPDTYGGVLRKSQLESLDSKPGIEDLHTLFDQDTQTGIYLPSNEEGVEITFNLDKTFMARSMTLYPMHSDGRFSGKIERLTDNGYEQMSVFKVDRRNTIYNVGFEKYAPVSISFNEVESKGYRLTLYDVEGSPGISKVELSAEPRIAYYKEKTLAKMHPTPLPYWDDYLWPTTAESTDEGNYLDLGNITDITSYTDDNGNLSWQIPEGRWRILHVGMLPTGVTNGPATKEGTGLEVDKMNHQHVIEHFDAFLGEIQRRIPEEDRRTWKVAVQDSYETGSQNWTDDLEHKFIASFGYSPIPYIPAMFGHVVISQDHSNRFLWDLRRFIADQIAYEYVGGLREISHQHDLTIWLENYGHWGFPGEFLQYGGQSDEIGGEFWNEGELGDIENRAASSAAHIYGKRKVSAESFTSSGNTFGRYPALLKARADRFFTEGINNSLLHVYVHQPYEDKKPGVNTWFGTEFNRHNTWFYDMDMFIDYLKRCNFLLQQGTYVADVAYFIGEDVPKMTGVQNPELPKGHDFDYMNAEVILDRMEIKDGQFTLPDGLQYKVLVLPDLETIRPEVLTKIAKMVEQGGTILGPKPKHSPSLTNFGQADQTIIELADKLWGANDGATAIVNKYGRGMVFSNVDLKEVFDYINLEPDFATDADSMLYIHRRLTDGDIYFLSNQRSDQVDFTARFRVGNGIPYLWDPVKGETRPLPIFDQITGTTKIPLTLDAHESCFIVFQKAPETSLKIPERERFLTNQPIPTQQVPVATPWQVVFQNDKHTEVAFAHLLDWKDSQDPEIKYFSGKATYLNTFHIDIDQTDHQRIKIDLGTVKAIAKVKINGTYVGGVWTPPYRLDITKHVRNGENKIEIEVVNTWVNRLIGDQHLAEKDRTTWTFENPYTPESPLHSSGLLGPVRIAYYATTL